MPCHPSPARTCRKMYRGITRQKPHFALHPCSGCHARRFGRRHTDGQCVPRPAQRRLGLGSAAGHPSDCQPCVPAAFALCRRVATCGRFGSWLSARRRHTSDQPPDHGRGRHAGRTQPGAGGCLGGTHRNAASPGPSSCNLGARLWLVPLAAGLDTQLGTQHRPLIRVRPAPASAECRATAVSIRAFAAFLGLAAPCRRRQLCAWQPGT